MVRAEPLSDFVVYILVISVVIAMLLGKYLMAKGDKPIEEVIEEDIPKDLDELEHELEDLVDDIGDKLK